MPSHGRSLLASQMKRSSRSTDESQSEAPGDGPVPPISSSPMNTESNESLSTIQPPLRLRLSRRVNRGFHRRLGSLKYNQSGCEVVAADWDFLVVLDACRPAALRAVLRGETQSRNRYNALSVDGLLTQGDLQRRKSRGSHTVEWLWGNFVDRQLHDTVYVSANVQPFLYQDGLNCHAVEHVWLDGFDPDLGTVPPAEMTDAALDIAARFPNKRLVVHYLQPHYPFRQGTTNELGTMAFWNAVAAGQIDVSRDQLRGWHRDNLEWVLPEVERFLSKVDGRAIITSDHATALGDRVNPFPIREWGHPWGIYARSLIEVPWLSVRNGSRRRLVREPPIEETGPDIDQARKQLAELGYL